MLLHRMAYQASAVALSITVFNLIAVLKYVKR